MKLFILLLLLSTGAVAGDYSSYDDQYYDSLDSYDIEDRIKDCEDEAELQHGTVETSEERHELIKLKLECREELGQR